MYLTKEQASLLYPINVFPIAIMLWLAWTPSPLSLVALTAQIGVLVTLLRHLWYKASYKPAKVFILKRDWKFWLIHFGTACLIYPFIS